MESNQLATLAGQAIDATNDAFNQFSQDLLAVDQQYLDGSQFDLQFFIRRCQHSAQTIAQHYLYLGRDLIVIKEHVDRFDFDAILDDIGISTRSAQRFMQVAIKFNKPTLAKMAARLTVTKLIELACEDDADLEQAINGGSIAGISLDEIERMSTRELKIALRKAKDDAQLTQEAHDRVLQQKNTHTDDLAKKLAIAEHRPFADRWPEQVMTYQEELNRYAYDAEHVLNAVFDIINTGDPHPDMPVSSRESIAKATVDRVNRLTELVGAMQNQVFHQYSEFLNQPAYELGDALTLKDEGE